jgi:hypothetical protein
MKALIDQWYTDNYKQLREVTTAWIVRYGRNLDAESIIANSYLYVISRMDEMTEEDVPKWVYQHINVELRMPKSVTNNYLNKHNIDKMDINEAFFVQTYEDLIDCVDVNYMIDDFKTTLDRYDQIIWDVYTKKGLTKKREMAEHFKIDETSAFFLIKNLKTKFKEYVNTEERI